LCWAIHGQEGVVLQPVAGEDHLLVDELLDAVRVGGGELVGRGGAPVLTDEPEPVVAELGHELGEVLGHVAHVEAARGVLGVPEAAHVRDDHPVVPGEQGDHMPPVVRGLGDAVQQQDGPALAGGHVVQPHSVDEGAAVPHQVSVVVDDPH
jgi:hypothetical protein